jgi:integrase
MGRDAATGRKRYRQHTMHGSRRDAERERVRLLRAHDTGTYVEPSRQSTGEYLERWLRDYARVHVAPSTYDRYQHIVRLQLIPALGHIPLVRLSPPDIKAHYASALQQGRCDGKGGLSPTTVLQHHRVLREALKHAVVDGLLMANPADRISPPRKARPEMLVLDQAQTTALLEMVLGTRLHIPVLLAVAAGLRRGEVLGLRWKDVDFHAGALAVQQTLDATSERLTLSAPKTPRSRRQIPLPAFALETLREHKRAQKEERLRLGPAFRNHDLVCAAPDGEPWDPDALTHAFAAFMRQCDLPRIRFHDLRHGHATLLLKLGTHPKVVSERLGHATVGLTLDVYSHVLPGMQKEATLALENALSPARPSPATHQQAASH